jgi:methylthioxylose transferase
MNSRSHWIAVLIGSLLSLGWLWFTQFPLGIAGEWTWNRIEHDHPGESFANLAGWLPLGAAWLALVCGLGPRLSRWSTRATALAVTGLVLLSFLMLVGLQSAAPAPIPQTKGWVLYYPQSSGYFHHARYTMENPATFLSGYEALMAEGDVGHIGTHPPGLFLLHRSAIDVCEAFPRWSDALLAFLPSSLEDSFANLEVNLRAANVVLTKTDRAAMWLIILLTHFAAALAIVPLFLLLQDALGVRVAWSLAACWPLIPALTVFAPKSDLLFPLLSLSFLWLWVRAHRSHSLLFGTFAGIVFWLGSLLSLAIVPSALIAGGYSLQRIVRSGESAPRFKPLGLTVGSSLGAFGLLTLGMGLIGEINLANVWVWNYRNHARFYAPENFPRTWWKWLLENPIETLFAVGLPLFYFAARGIGRCLRDRSDFGLLVSSAAATWALIWLSGKNSGETARLWIVFFPWFCLGCGCSLKPESPEQKEPLVSDASLRALLLVQLGVCLATSLRVSGFHF